MTPTTAELLAGNMKVLSIPPPEESAGAYSGGMVGVTGMISLLAAQEAEQGAAVRVEETTAIREVLEKLAKYASVPQLPVPELSISALDAVNADARRALISVHEQVEAAGDVDADQMILALYRRMARLRRLELPGMPGV